MIFPEFPFQKEITKDLAAIGIKFYYVGGIVRDFLLGDCDAITPHSDIDIVIPGTTLDSLQSLFSCYGPCLLTGSTFPVLKYHNVDIAIPRIEISTGPGHSDFSITIGPDVTIEQDLVRRDLTINAIAYNPDDGFVDPTGGLMDIKNKILRVTSPNSYRDDPIRIFRTIRFYLTLQGEWTIDPDTMKAMVSSIDNVGYATTGRVRREIQKCLKDPIGLFEILQEVGIPPECGVTPNGGTTPNGTPIPRLDYPEFWFHFYKIDNKNFCGFTNKDIKKIESLQSVKSLEGLRSPLECLRIFKVWSGLAGMEPEKIHFLTKAPLDVLEMFHNGTFPINASSIFEKLFPSLTVPHSDIGFYIDQYLLKLFETVVGTMASGTVAPTIVVEGLDNSGKNTWVKTHYPDATIVDFPIRNGKFSKEINSFLAGEIEYSSQVEEWFLENRLEWYRNGTTTVSNGTTTVSNGTTTVSNGTTTVGDSAASGTITTVLVRSGISYLIYKWYRTGVEPTIEEYSRESDLLSKSSVVFLESQYSSPEEKGEIYDSLPDVKREELKRLFQAVIKKLKVLTL